MPEASKVQVLVAEIDAERKNLKKILSSVDRTALTWHPKVGERSIVENVRHLLFHEQGIERQLRSDFTWSPLGLPPPGLQNKEELRPAGTQPSTNLDEVMAAWDAIHRSVQRRLRGADPSTAPALQKVLRHLRTHIRIIERILRKAERERR